MADIIAMPNTRYADNKSVVETLEEILKAAKDGYIQGVAVAWVTMKGGIDCEWSDNNDVAPMVGAVSLMQARLLREIDDQNDA